VLALSSDGAMIASGQADDSLAIWHARTGKKLHEIRWKAAGFYTAFSPPDDKTLSCRGPSSIVLLVDLTTGKERH
jgi:WD40 repeat protein